MDNSLEKGELSHLRHKLQCADVLNNDLMDEIKLLQDDNSKLTNKVSELERRLSKTQAFNSPSYRKDVSFNRSLSAAGDIEAEFLDLSTKYEKLQEEMRKNKMMVMELEDNLYSVRKERDELERKIEQKDDAVKSLKEALKNVEAEFMENVDEKGVLNSKLADKEAVIESLRVHCNQLEEMQVVSRSGDERKSFGAALLRNYCPNLSADTSHSFSMIEESNAVLDLGSEVIDIQLREAKASLEKAEESLRHCQDEKNKLEVKCQQIEEQAKLTEEELLSRIRDCQSELEIVKQERISSDMKNQKLIEDLQSTINSLQGQLEAIKTESATLADQLSDKCSELVSTKAQLEKSEDQNSAMSDEIKRVSSAWKTTEESIRVLQTELDTARSTAEATEKELLCKIQEYKTELEELEHDKAVADAKSHTCIQDLQRTISTLQGQLEAIKTESSTLADQLRDKCSEQEATKAQLEMSENQNAFMAEENKRINTVLKSTEESVLTVQKELEDAMHKCELAEQRADDAEISAVVRIAEEAAQCKEIYERKIEQCRAELTMSLENVEEDLRRCQEERDNAKIFTEQLLLKVKDCETELEMLKQEKLLLDSQNQKLIEDLHTNVNSLEGQLEAFEIESSTLAIQLNDKCSQLETIKKQLEKSEDQNALMSEEIKRISVVLKTAEESFLAAESGREEALSKCQLAEQRADQAEKDAIIRIAEEVTQCHKAYEEKTNQYQIEMEKVLKNSEENLKECQDDRDSLITKCRQQEELAKGMEKELRCKIQDCESEMEMLKQEKSRLDSQNQKRIEDLQNDINSLECQLEAIKAESSNLAGQLSEKSGDLETITKQLEKSEDQNAALSEEIQHVYSTLRTTEETVGVLQVELDTARSGMQLAEERADQAEKDAVIRIAEEVAHCKEDYEEKSNQYRIEMEKVLEKAERNIREGQEERDNLITKFQQQDDRAKVAEKQLLQQIQDLENTVEELQKEKSRLNSTTQKCIEDLQTTIDSVQRELEATKAEKVNLADKLSEKSTKLEATMTQLEDLRDQNATISEEMQRVCSALKTTEESVRLLQVELDTARTELQSAIQRADKAEKDAVIRIADEVALCKQDYEEKSNHYRGEMEKVLQKTEGNLKECQEERDELIVKCQQQEDRTKVTEKQLLQQIQDLETMVEDLQQEKSRLNSTTQKCIEDLQITIASVQGELEAIKAEKASLIEQLSEKSSKLEATITQLEELEDRNATISEETHRFCSALKLTEESVRLLQVELDTARTELQSAVQRADKAEKDAIIRIADEVALCKQDYEEKSNHYRGEMEKVLEKTERNLKECQEERDDLKIKCQQQEDQAKLTEKECSSQIKDCEVKIEELQQEKSQINLTNQKLTEDLQSTISSLQGQLEAIKTESSTLADQLSEKCNDLETVTKQLEKSEDENAAISEEIQRVCSTLKTTENFVVAVQAELDTARSQLNLAEQRADKAEKDAIIRIAEEVAQCKEDYEEKSNHHRVEMEKVLEKTERNLKEYQEERDELISKCQQQEDQAKLIEKQHLLTIADVETRLDDLMKEKSQHQKRIQDLESTISTLEGQLEAIKTESSTLAGQFSDKCSELETVRNQLERLEDQNKQISQENKQINAALKTTEDTVLEVRKEREAVMHECQLAEQRAVDAEKSAVIRIAEETAQCKEIYEQKTEQYRAEMETALEKAVEDVRKCEEEKAALGIKCQEAEDKISLTEKELLSKIQEWATEVEDLKQEKLSLNMKNQKATEDLQSTINSLQSQLQAVKVENSTLIEQLNKKSNDLEIFGKEMQALQAQNALISEKNQQINLALKTLEESSRVFQAERETAVHKWQLAEQRANNAEKNVDLRITKEMAQCKQNYAQKTEQFRASVKKLLEEEMDKVKELKQLLHATTEERDELKKKYDELKRKHEDAISSQSHLEEQGEKLKREVGQLRRDYLQSQHVIHLLETTLNKQTERLQQLESSSEDHKFLAPSGGSFQSLNRRHQMSDSNLSASNSRRESCSSIASAHVPRRRSDETDDRRLSSVSIASTCSNTSSSSGKFKVVPDGSGCFFKCEDEDEFQFQETNLAALKHKRQIGSTKLPGLKGDARSEEDRFSELFRRNTMVPLHLKSCYPSEYITCDDAEVDENKLKQLPGYTRSTSGPLVGRLKDVSTLSLPVSLVFSPPRKQSSVALSSRKPLGETSQF